MSTTTSTPEPVPGSAGALTIHHDYESGTTVEGTEKHSPAHHAIKANRSWTWSRHAEAWLLRSSRHRSPKLGAIALMERTLTALGYAVTREIDEAMPNVEQREADLAGRIDDRATRLAERADTWSSRADATRAKADAVFDNIPLGQPMMPGHHSYNADRNRRERAWNGLGKSIEQGAVANELSRRSAEAAAHMGARHNPVTVGNRIEKLEADRRAVARQLDSNTDSRTVVRVPGDECAQRLHREAADLDEQINYWKGVYSQLQADGKASTAGPHNVAKGDFVLVRGQWYRVRRANTKTVAVPNHMFTTPQPGRRESTRTTPWHEVRDHRRAEQMPEAFVAAYEEPGRDRIRLKLADYQDGVS